MLHKILPHRFRLYHCFARRHLGFTLDLRTCGFGLAIPRRREVLDQQLQCRSDLISKPRLAATEKMHLLRQVLPAIAVMKAEEAEVVVGMEIAALVRPQGEHFHSLLENRSPLIGLPVEQCRLRGLKICER